MDHSRPAAERSSRAGSRIVSSARWIMLAIGLVAGLMQLVEHFRLDSSLQANLFLIAEVIFYILVLPLMGWALLNLLERSERKGSQAAHALTQQYALVRTLAGAEEWNELVQQVVEYPHFVLPVSACSLYVRDEKSGAFNLAGFWSQGQGEPVEPAVSVAECETCYEGKPGLQRLEGDGSEEPRYLLPLCLGGETWGLMQLRLPPHTAPGEAQVEVLSAISTDLALVLDRARLRSSARSQAAATAEVRRQVAQDLHDTLAQNIAYLRLKLEELLLEENPSRQVSLIRGDLRRMHDTADEAYAQMRDTLDNLQTGESRDLLEVLRERAQAVSERAGLEVSLSQQGAPPAALDAAVKRQVTYVCREALNNIERHSRATQVKVQLYWQADCLTMTIADNGVGFNPAAVDTRRHYGLMIMRERAESAGGDLSIVSAAGQGATITMAVPLERAGLEHVIATPAVQSLAAEDGGKKDGGRT